SLGALAALLEQVGVNHARVLARRIGAKDGEQRLLVWIRRQLIAMDRSWSGRYGWWRWESGDRSRQRDRWSGSGRRPPVAGWNDPRRPYRIDASLSSSLK